MKKINFNHHQTSMIGPRKQENKEVEKEEPKGDKKEESKEDTKDDEEKEGDTDTESSESEDEVIGPVLKVNPQPKKSLMELHQQRHNSKNKITKFDHKEGLNKEVRQEILKNLNKNGGLSGKFTKGK